MVGDNWNYLRVRGEYESSTATTEQLEELPPRARRIPQQRRHNTMVGGTTSACAENTRNESQYPRPQRNYLRVRGEYKYASWPIA